MALGRWDLVEGYALIGTHIVGQAKDALADDVAQDLVRTAFDAGGAGGEGGAGGSGGLAPYTQDEVQGIINASCSCHVQGMSGGMSLAGDFTVNTVGVDANGAPVARIEPGDRTQSYLFHKIAGTQGDVGGGGGRMPLGGQPLSDEQIERIGLWIDSL